jgi:hypothetical protein
MRVAGRYLLLSINALTSLLFLTANPLAEGSGIVKIAGSFSSDIVFLERQKPIKIYRKVHCYRHLEPVIGKV